jgi:hypothetical protein
MQPLSMPTSSGWENEPLRPVVQGQPSPAPTSGLGAGIGIMKPPFQQVVGNQGIDMYMF